MTSHPARRNLPNDTGTLRSLRRKTIRHKMMTASLVSGLMALALAVNAQVPDKHIHGQAELNIAIEPGSVTLMLSSPLDNILGFEHAPRTVEEQAQVKTTEQRLKHGDQLFTLHEAASCNAAQVTFGYLFPGPQENKTAHHEHGHASDDTHNDAELTVEFTCTAGISPQFIDTKPLFDAFTRLQTLQVQIAGPKGQRGLTVPRDNPRFALPN